MGTTPAVTANPRATSLLRNRGFAHLLAAQAVSQAGTQFSVVAFPLTAVLVLHGSAIQLGALAAARSFPYVLVAPAVGVWIDRVPRRGVLVFANLGRGVLLLAIPAAALTGTLSFALMYVVALLVGVLDVCFDVAYQSFIPSLVERRRLVDANGTLEATRSLAEISAPAVAGFVVQLVSAPIAILADAASFLGAAALLRRIQAREQIARASASRNLWKEMVGGLRLVFGNVMLRTLAGYTASSNFFFGATDALYALFLVRDLGIRPAEFGILVGVASVGGLLGASSTGRVARAIGLGNAIVLGAMLTRAGFVPIPFAGESGLEVTWLLLALGQLSWGLGVPIYNVNQISLRQAITPSEQLGRMNASMRFVVVGTRPIGAIFFGALASALGVRSTLAIAAIGALAALGWLAISPASKLRHLPDS